jgi:hypothetical protein
LVGVDTANRCAAVVASTQTDPLMMLKTLLPTLWLLAIIAWFMIVAMMLLS